MPERQESTTHAPWTRARVAHGSLSTSPRRQTGGGQMMLKALIIAIVILALISLIAENTDFE
jgi:hypothetical protein